MAFSHRTRVLCDVPDGGALVSVFGDASAWSSPELGCAVFPLACAKESARQQVLDGGALAYPAPRREVRTDAEGWFEVELDDDSLLFIDCGAHAGIHTVRPPWQDERAWQLSLRTATRPDFPDGAARVLVVNPFTRQRAVLTRETWAKAPVALLREAWMTTEPLDGGAPRTKLPRTDLRAHAEAPSLDGGLVSIRVQAAAGLARQPLFITLQSKAGDEVRVETGRANGGEVVVAPGPWTLEVQMLGAQTVRRELRVGRGRTDVSLQLEPAVASRGRVVDATDRPVMGACISTGDEWRWSRCEAVSDSRGEFALRPPERGEARVLRAMHLELGASPLVRPQGVNPVVLKLASQREVRLDVRVPSGVPAEGGLQLTSLTGGHRAFVPLRAGVVSLGGLPAGAYRLALSSGDAWLAPLELTAPDTGRVEARVELKPLATVSGVVLRGGKPLAKVLVGSERARSPTETDAQGRFTLAGLPHEPVKVYVDQHGKFFEVKAPARVEFELTTGALRVLP